MTGPGDATLLARLSSGTPEEARGALDALYGRHAGDVLRFVRRLVPDGNDAEDTLQDTFLAAARSAAGFRGQSALPWLLKIAANRVRDERRRRRRRADRERDSEREHVERPEVGDDLEVALATLPAKYRAAVELRFVDGLEHTRVAEVLGVSTRTAKEWSKRGLERLRERMEES